MSENTNTSTNTHNISNLTSEETQFKREIGVFGGVSIIGGIMIGSGIFYLGSYVIMRCGMNLGLALICWILGGLISLFGGLCYAELGAAMPRAGGSIVYLNEAFHPVVGFMSGFTGMLIGGPGTVAALAIALMTALRDTIGLDDTGIKISAIVITVVMTGYNLIGVKFAAMIQNLSMVAKLIPIFVILVTALTVGGESPSMSLDSAFAHAASNDTNVLSMMAFAIVATLWAYEGWTNLNTVTEEMKEPRRNLPLALIIAIGGVTVLYALFNFAIMRVLPYDTIVSKIQAKEVYLGTEVATRVLGPAGAAIVSAGMIISMFGSLNGFMLAGPRVAYAMSAEGHFFKIFSYLHPRFRVPSNAIILQCVISIVLIMSNDLNSLTSMVVVSSMLFKMLVILAVPRLRKKYPDIARPYRVPLYPISVVITSIIFLALLVNSWMSSSLLGIIGFCVPAAGAVIYFIFDRNIKNRAS